MDLIDTLVKGAIGFFTGGPVGAAAGVATSLLGGDEQAAPAQAQAQAQQPVRMTMPQAPAAGGAQDLAYWRGYLEQVRLQAAQRPPTDRYSATTAMTPAAGAPAALHAFNAQAGGMSSPRQAGNQYYQTMGAGDGKGAGGAGAGTATADPYQDLLRKYLGSAAPAASPAAPAFQGYMQRALAGQNTLPAGAMQEQAAQGATSIGQQALASRRALTEALSQRGMLHSGLAATGLQGIEESRLGAVGQLQTGLREQGLTAARESQRQAAGLYPSLLSVDQSARSTAMSGYLAMRQLELEAQRIGLSQQQIDAFKQQNDYAGLANIVAGLWQVYRGGTGQAGAAAGAAQGYSGAGNIAPGWPAGGYDYSGNYTPYG